MQNKPKKSLGQNFLFDKNIQRKIIENCEINPCDLVLEIGAGQGALTGLIAQKAGRVLAVEIDQQLSRQLKDKLKAYKNIEVINKDILKLDLKRYYAGSKEKIKVIGNIPYYITTPIIEHLIKYSGKIDKVFLTVQKEFAARMVAKAGEDAYGSFSCFLQYYAKAKILFPISKSCFFPRPKVDSAFLRLEINQTPPVAAKDESLLFKIIRAAFNQRRKILTNSLKYLIPGEKLTQFFKKYNISPNTRPEQLTLQDFANLSNL